MKFPPKVVTVYFREEKGFDCMDNYGRSKLANFWLDNINKMNCKTLIILSYTSLGLRSIISIIPFNIFQSLQVGASIFVSQACSSVAQQIPSKSNEAVLDCWSDQRTKFYLINIESGENQIVPIFNSNINHAWKLGLLIVLQRKS